MIYDSDYSVRLATLEAMGGDVTKQFDSVYEIDLAILDIIQHGGGGGEGARIDDNNTSTGTTWSSSKIVSELTDAGFDVEIVTELPSTGDAHTIYFMASASSQTGNVYDEWMYINNNWEQVGSTAIDLSNYYTKSETNALVANKVNIVELTQAEYNALSTASKNDGSIYSITDATIVDPANYYTKSEANAAFNPYHTTFPSSGSYKFPNWNARGQITGQASQAYQISANINGTSKTLYATATGNLPTVYAPTSAGTAGQYLVSSGNGAPTWQNLEVASDYVIADADASTGTYSTDIAAFYAKTISENVVQGVQIKIVDEHVVDNASVYSDSYYLPSSSRIYNNNVELWLMTTEDGATWENIHYLITGNSITRDVSTGSFGPVNS